MDPNSFKMFMGAAADTGIVLPAIGASYEGGFYAGSISHTADGVATHALIVAPASSGYNTSGLKWQNTATTTGATSDYDGASNTSSISDSPAASFCTGLTINGYSDWYFPARFELEIAYYNLKPTTQSNTTSYGANSYAVPQRSSNYTSSDPAQTSVSAFQSGGSEAFETGYHHTSTEDSSSNAWVILFNQGLTFPENKLDAQKVRAFRKIAL
jgi:hypothetical protein